MRKSNRTWRWIVTGVGAVAAIGTLGFVTYRVARAAGRPDTPRYPPVPGEAPAGPLRPDAPEIDPGPLAERLGDLMADLSDDELQAARNSMPPHWWAHIKIATATPDDETFTLALQPIGVELGMWSPSQSAQLRNDLISSVGVIAAMKLQQILSDAGISV